MNYKKKGAYHLITESQQSMALFSLSAKLFLVRFSIIDLKMKDLLFSGKNELQSKILNNPVGEDYFLREIVRKDNQNIKKKK